MRKSDADLEKLRRHHTILFDLARLASRMTSLDVVFEQTVLHTARAVEIDHVKLLRYRPESGDLLVEAGTGWNEGVVGATTLTVDLGSPAGRAFLTAQPVSIVDIAAGSEFTLSPVMKEHGIVSLLNVPILIDDAAWGVLEVDSTVPRDFSEDTLLFMLATAALVGMAVRREASEQAHAQAVAAVAAEVNKRELLLQEMQHRVKNNFQIILSLLATQRPKFPMEAGRMLVDEIGRKIMAMSLAHDQLSPRQEAEVVNLPSYLQALSTSIEQPLERISINVEADELEVGIEQAVPIGLIVNELVTNSVKHAFGEAGGAVRIVLQSGVGRGEARLSVSDNGRGIDPAHAGGSGLKLIRALARQIGGRVDHESSPAGTRTCVQFAVLR